MFLKFFLPRVMPSRRSIHKFDWIPRWRNSGLETDNILWLAHAEGYSHREIAEITGLGAASVRLLLFRARRKIAKLLQEQSAPGRQA